MHNPKNSIKFPFLIGLFAFNQFDWCYFHFDYMDIEDWWEERLNVNFFFYAIKVRGQPRVILLNNLFGSLTNFKFTMLMVQLKRRKINNKYKFYHFSKVFFWFRFPFFSIGCWRSFINLWLSSFRSRTSFTNHSGDIELMKTSNKIIIWL